MYLQKFYFFIGYVVLLEHLLAIVVHALQQMEWWPLEFSNPTESVMVWDKLTYGIFVESCKG